VGISFVSVINTNVFLIISPVLGGSRGIRGAKAVAAPRGGTLNLEKEECKELMNLSSEADRCIKTEAGRRGEMSVFFKARFSFLILSRPFFFFPFICFLFF